MNNYAISDIHGCAKTFKALLNKIDFSKSDQLFLLGDYVDRGPDSKGVIDHIWALQEGGYSIECLLGNHEVMLLDALQGMDNRSFWERNGGKQTLSSFGASRPAEIPQQYLDWIRNLSYYHEVDHYILVHAGFSFDMPNPFDELHSMLWARNWYDKINYRWLGNRIIIHGHTPTDLTEMEQRLLRIKQFQTMVIDNGCVFTRNGLGQLAAFDMIEKRLITQKCVD